MREQHGGSQPGPSLSTERHPTLRWHLIVDPHGYPGSANMAIDQELLDAAQNGMDAFLRLYCWSPPCLSFGRNEPALRRYDIERIRQHGYDTVRRPTGGRAVWHEHETTYAVAAPLETFGSLRETYREIHSMLGRALGGLGVVLTQASRSSGGSLGDGSCFAGAVGGELVAGGSKVVGSAQLREGNAFLQHGSILLEDGQDVVSRLSTGPVRPTSATSLSAILKRPVTFDETCRVIVQEARTAWGGDWQAERTSTLAVGHRNFGDPAWTWRR